MQSLDFHLREIRFTAGHLSRCADLRLLRGIRAANPAETRSVTAAKVEILRNKFFIVIVPVPSRAARLGLHLPAPEQPTSAGGAAGAGVAA